MDIIVNKKTFLNKLLIPISKFTDQTTLNFTNDYIDSIAYTTLDKQSIILYAKIIYKASTPITEPLKLNIGSIKKLISAFNCIKDDIVELSIEQNNISYNSIDSKFRFHLKEDISIERPTINLEKIDKTIFDVQLVLNNEKLSEMLKACGYSSDSDKVYIYTSNNAVVCDMTDKTIQNLDSISVTLADSFIGTPLFDPIILRNDIFKIISSIKFDECELKINTKGIVVFEIKDDESKLKYITTSLIK